MKSRVLPIYAGLARERMCFMTGRRARACIFWWREWRPCIRLIPWERKKVIFVYGPGNLLNEDSLLRLTSAVNCEVREDSLVMVLPAERFIQVMDKDGRLAREVMGAMALKIRRLYRQLKNTTNALSGEKRLAAKLLNWEKIMGYVQGTES